MSCRVGEHVGGISKFAVIAHPRSSPALLSAAASVVSKQVTRKSEQVLNACNDAIIVLPFDGITGVLKGVSDCVGPSGLQLGGDKLWYFDIAIRRLGRLADTSSACWTSRANVPRKSSTMPCMCVSPPGCQ